MWDKINRFHCAIVDHFFTDTRADRYEPCRTRGEIPSPMMLKAIPAGVIVRVTAKVWKNEKGCFSRIFWLLL